MQKLIHLIDDDPAVLDLLKSSLRPHFQIRLATRGRKGIELSLMEPLPDLILLDLRLPDLHGFDVCTELKRDARTKDIPVIFLTSDDDNENVVHGFDLGAVDYLSKPVNPPIMLARIKTQLRLREAHEHLRDQNCHLEHLVDIRTRDLQLSTEEMLSSRDLTIVALGSIAETRDNETGNHIHRTRGFVKALTRRLEGIEKYKTSTSTDQWAMIWKSSPLHDIGKVGIPDHILLKPGKLSAEEFAVMKSHARIGRDALRSAESRLGRKGSFLDVAKEIAYAHHERWDGSGYPEGISREAIPLSARVMAIADVYDAMTSERVYKASTPHALAVDVIRDARGKDFDPSLVDCFLDDPGEFAAIAKVFSDGQSERLTAEQWS